MTVKKLNDGEWICDLRPSGVKGKRIRKNSQQRARL
jgi:hypothetical protein